MSSQQDTSNLIPTFEPPPGGDICLRSVEDTTFRVHSVVLGLVSSVFADMLSIGKASGEEIQLDDDSEAISLMLAFTYPSSVTPTINNLDALEKCLVIAQKYNIEKIVQTLERDLVLAEARTGMLCRKDPLRAFRISRTYGLRECQTLAAKAIMPRHIDLRNPTAIILRSKILADVLFNFEGELLPKTWVKSKPGQKKDFMEDDEGGGLLMCDKCAAQLDDLWLITARPIDYLPSWLYGWTRYAYDHLSTNALDDCDYVFEPQFLVDYVYDSIDVCEGCIEAAVGAKTRLGGIPGEEFTLWGKNVRRGLANKLGELDSLYSL